MLKNVLFFALLTGSIAQAAQAGKATTQEKTTAQKSREHLVATAIEALTNHAADQGFTFDPIQFITSHSVVVESIRYVSNGMDYPVSTRENICNLLFPGMGMSTDKTLAEERSVQYAVYIAGNKVRIDTGESKEQVDKPIKTAICQAGQNLIE